MNFFYDSGHTKKKKLNMSVCLLCLNTTEINFFLKEKITSTSYTTSVEENVEKNSRTCARAP